MGWISRAFFSWAPPRLAVFLGAVIAMTAASPAGAEGQVAHGPSEAIFLIQLL